MQRIKKSLLVPYTTEEMYQLVNDIEHYPIFLPWCRSTTVFERKPGEVRASIQIAKGAMHYSFTTLNKLNPNKSIEMKLLEGPFRHLEGCWLFEDTYEGCILSLDLSFEFSNKLLALTAGPVLQKIVETFVEAFRDRAKKCYEDQN